MPAVRAKAKQIGASPKRLKPIMDAVRGMTVTDALDQLNLMTSPWARSVAKVVQSAASNAENNQFMNRDELRITRISADQARPIKRFRPRARGRIGRVTRRSSHIIIEVDEIQEN
jgi:large subunit ribosomal protein L22